MPDVFSYDTGNHRPQSLYSIYKQLAYKPRAGQLALRFIKINLQQYPYSELVGLSVAIVKHYSVIKLAYSAANNLQISYCWPQFRN